MSDSSAASTRDAEFRAIEEKAAEWFGRCELGLTPEQERELMRWLEADARHGEAMREMDETWEFLDRLKEIRRPHATEVSTRSRFSWRAATLLAAAAIAIALLGVWQLRTPRAKQAARQIATEAGSMKRIELPDGSEIYLNASSRIDVRFTAQDRRVQLLQGEAHFAVAKDPTRPFLVSAGDVAVRAVGTVFNVRRAAGAVEVFVSEGKVRVDDASRGASLLAKTNASPASVSEAELLVAGQRAIVPLNAEAAPQPASVTAIAPAEIQQALAWQVRQLDFDQTPLADVVAEFNRYNTHQLVIADPELARQRFGGSFRADNYRVFVQLLEQRFGVTAERDEDKTVLRRAK